MNCSGCSKSLTDSNCNAKCPKLKYKNFDCSENGKDTICTLKKLNKLTKQQVKK